MPSVTQDMLELFSVALNNSLNNRQKELDRQYQMQRDAEEFKYRRQVLQNSKDEFVKQMAVRENEFKQTMGETQKQNAVQNMRGFNQDYITSGEAEAYAKNYPGLDLSSLSQYPDTQLEPNYGGIDAPAGQYIKRADIDALLRARLSADQLAEEKKRTGIMASKNQQKFVISDGWNTYNYDPNKQRTPEELKKVESMINNGYRILEDTPQGRIGMQLSAIQPKFEQPNMDLLSYATNSGWRSQQNTNLYDIPGLSPLLNTLEYGGVGISPKQKEGNTKGALGTYEQIIKPWSEGKIQLPPMVVFGIVKNLYDDVSQGNYVNNPQTTMIDPKTKKPKKTTLKQALKNIVDSEQYANIFTSIEEMKKTADLDQKLKMKMLESAASQYGKDNSKEVTQHFMGQ